MHTHHEAENIFYTRLRNIRVSRLFFLPVFVIFFLTLHVQSIGNSDAQKVADCTSGAAGALGTVEKCFVDGVRDGLKKVSAKVQQKASPLSYTMVSIAIVLLSYRLALGAEPKLVGPVSVLALKIIIVLALVNTPLDEIHDKVYEDTKKLGDDVLSAFVVPSGYNKNTTGASGDVFSRFDAFISGVFNFNGGGGSNKGSIRDKDDNLISTKVYVSLSLFIIMILFTGPFGFLILSMLVTVMVTLVIASAKMLYLYLLSYIVVGFLLLLTPLFAGLILFKSTAPIFERWFTWLFLYSVVPFMVTVFVALFIHATSLSISSLTGHLSQLTNYSMDENGEGNKFFRQITIFDPATIVNTMDNMVVMEYANVYGGTLNAGQAVLESTQDMIEAEDMQSFGVALSGTTQNTLSFVFNNIVDTVLASPKISYNIAAWGVNNLAHLYVNNTEQGKKLREMKPVQMPVYRSAAQALENFFVALCTAFFQFTILMGLLMKIPRIVESLMGNAGVASMADTGAMKKMDEVEEKTYDNTGKTGGKMNRATGG